MSRIAFKMQLLPGKVEEYKRRHDAIWPELSALLTQSGISDYSIFLDEERLELFAVQNRTAVFSERKLVNDPIMRRWWSYMRDIMEVEEDDSPTVYPLVEVFHLP